MARGKDFDGDGFEFEDEQFEIREESPEVPEDVLDFLEVMLEAQGVEISISFNGDRIRWNAKSPRVNELLKNAVKGEEKNHIESCLEIGDAVLSYASVQTSEKTLEKYFGGVTNELAQKVRGLDALRIKVEKAYRKHSKHN